MTEIEEPIIGDLKWIKKHYGEKMMQLCKKLFPTILDNPGELKKIMEASFYPSKTLFYDLVNEGLEYDFYDYIEHKFEKTEIGLKTTTKTPHELMKKAGYELFECHTEEDIQSFRKYYSTLGETYLPSDRSIPKHIGEELCTFDGKRLDYCHVFFAVKEGAEKLRREDFTNPRREDEYGISVISIQFTINRNILSIKNRYNDTVYRPDATFGNNLENIIPGLTDSFQRFYGFKIKQEHEVKLEIPQYVKAEGKFYKYNYKIRNIYYCPNNIIIINGKAKQYPQEQYIIMDYYILDLKAKKMTIIDDRIKDSFVEIHEDIEQIEIKKEDNKKLIIITSNGVKSIITVNNENQIIEYKNIGIKEIKDNFMMHNQTLEQISFNDLEKMGQNCFESCKTIKEIDLPKLKELGIFCFAYIEELEKLELPKLQIMNSFCFNYTKSIEKIAFPELRIMYDSCFCNCKSKIIDLPQLEKIESYCFHNCDSNTNVNAPKIVECNSDTISQILDFKHHK